MWNSIKYDKMRNLTLLLLIVFFSCNDQNNHPESKEMEIGEIKWTTPLNHDTIVERIDPARLNLEEQQLFIDISRNSRFKRRIKEWQPITRKEILEQINDFEAKKNYPEIEKRWLSIRKYKDQFYNYDPCDGKDFRMEIRGNALIFERHEKNIFKIEEVSINKEQWLIKSTFSPDIDLVIEKTKIKNLYTLNFKSLHAEKKYYITPFENIDNFDLIVNHCPTEKVREFEKFQGPE